MSKRLVTGVALFRGVNVGGRGLLPMRELVDLLHALGLQQVRTCLQSGNAVFRHHDGNPCELADRIAGEVHRRRGFEPAVLVLDVGRLEKVVRDNPFPEAAAEPKSLHAGFLWSQPTAPDLEGLERIGDASERFELGDRVFYLHTPGGFGRSKLATRVEKLLGVPVTARNWRSVTKILELARSLG